MNANFIAKIASWERSAGTRLVAYCASDQGGKAIGSDDIVPVFESLRRIGQVARLDVLLVSEGGNLSAAHRLATLLREYCQHLRILIPFRARSAATLLCLAADELLIGPMGELSPLDPIIRSDRNSGGGMPEVVSSEEIRLFRQMTQTWLGFEPKQDSAEILQIATQRFFPTALTEFFRADRYVQTLGEQLIKYQLANVSEQVRAKIVDHLVHGFHSHQHGIARGEAEGLGLRVRRPSVEDEELLWSLWDDARIYIKMRTSAQGETTSMIRAISFSRDYATEYLASAASGKSAAPNQTFNPYRLGWSQVELG